MDTHLLLWSASAPEQLSARATEIIADEATEPMFSVASIWELVIKNSLGRPDFAVDPSLLRRGLLRSGYGELDIAGQHALAVADLDGVHRDPFDRMLVAQARHEGIDLVTNDPLVARYGGRIELV